MRLVIIGTADDVEVTMGLRMLLEQRAVTDIAMPEADINETHDQIIVLASEKGIPVAIGGSVEDLLSSLGKGDMVAIAWDDSDEVFDAVVDLDGSDNEVWDIADGLTLVDTKTEALEERLSEVLEDFVESLSALVYKMVMDQVNGQGKWKYRRPDAD